MFWTPFNLLLSKLKGNLLLSAQSNSSLKTPTHL